MSEHLSTCSVPHLVVERHRIAERWRWEKWDSLVANGPAWHDRFPGMEFPDTHADAFVHKEKVADYFVAYASSISHSRPLWRGSKGSPQGCRSSWVSHKNVGPSNRGQQCGRSHRGFSAPDDASACSWKRRAHADPLQLLSSPNSCRRVQYWWLAQDPLGCRSRKNSGFRASQFYLSVGPHDRPPRSYRQRDYCWWLGVLGKWDAQAKKPGTEHVTIAVSGASGGHTIDFRRLATQGITLLGRTENRIATV